MLITVAGFKGGVGKTTIAVHLAAYLSTVRPTLLVDCDPNQSAKMWSDTGDFDFPCALLNEETEELIETGKYPFVVADTKARENRHGMLELAEFSDLVILPSRISKLDVHGLVGTLRALNEVPDINYAVLLTMTPAMVSRRVGLKTQLAKNKRLTEMRNYLEEQKIPVFKTEIQHFAAFEQGPEYGCLAKDFEGLTAAKAWTSINSFGGEVLERLGL